MSRGTTPPRAVVADGRALERNLACFLLQEQGYLVAAEATSAADLTRAVKELSPDVVVAHESTAMERGASVIPGIRRSSPWTRIIVVTSDRAATPAVLVDEADAVVEEGTGLKDLPLALAPPAVLEPTIDPVGAQPTRARVTPELSADTEGSVVPLAPRRPGRPRWLERLQVVAAASILVLAVVLARGAGPGSPVAPVDPDAPDDPRIEAAFETLEELVAVAETATPAQIEELVQELLAYRAAAALAGLDTSALDAEIADLIVPLLETIPTENGDVIETLLGDLIEDAIVEPSPDVTSPPDEGPSIEPPAEETEPPAEDLSPVVDPPVESPSPDASPLPDISPIPSESPPPDPVETPSPSESPDPSESPSPSESPDPSESPEPTDPTDPPEPTDPTDPPEPTDPTDPPEPTDPTDPPEPTDPTDPPEPTDPTDPPEPSETKTPDPSPSKSLPIGPPDKETTTGAPDPASDHGQGEDGDDQGEDGDDQGEDGTAAGSLVVIPPSLILLLAGSGVARRFTRRDRGR
jgi:hypothetical protein